MLTIACTFDEELGPGGMDPLGNITISDGQSQINIEETYLDSWLVALIESIDQLGSRSGCNLKTEERDPMEIHLAFGGRIEISYKDRTVRAEGVRELEIAVRAACVDFFQTLETSDKARREASCNRSLDPIRRFLLTTRN
jgi:hypothetical protein